MFLSAKYAYYNTGFMLTPEGGMGLSSGRDLIAARSYGSTVQSLERPPADDRQRRPQLVPQRARRVARREVRLRLAPRQRDDRHAVAGQRHPRGACRTRRRRFAQVFREGSGTNRTQYFDAYVGDTISKGRATLDLGVRYDRQGGSALPSTTAANPAFPALVPGLIFAGYDAPFTWNNVSPRAGFTYALDEARKTVARASYARFAGQLDSASVGYMNPSSSAGVAVYRWIDLNGDHLASADEVLTNQFLGAANGFNPANPTAVTSANRIDPDLKAPVTQSFVAGLERELRPNLAVSVNYTYTRTTDLLGNATFSVTPRVGVSLADYTAGPVLTGTLPDGSAYSVPTYIPNQAKVTAGGSGFLLTNWNGYSTDYHGVEFSAVKRLSNRWMGRVGSRSTTRASTTRRRRCTTPTATRRGRLPSRWSTAASSRRRAAATPPATSTSTRGGSSTPTACIRRRTASSVAANVFGRQGYPFPLFRTQALGADTGLSVLVTPQIDTFRYDNVWDTDLRVARTFKLRAVSLRADRRRLQRDEREHGADPQQQRAVDRVQHDRAEPQPADSPSRAGRSSF